jgi:hypothetical protein
MKRRCERLEQPRGRDDLALIRRGRDGVWWQAADGMRIRLAAEDREPAIDRARLSLLAVLLALIAGGRPRS